MVARRHTARSRNRFRLLATLGVSAGVHALVLTLLLAGLQPPSQAPETPAVDMQFLRLAPPPPADQAAAPAPRGRSASRHQAPPPPAGVATTPAPVAPTGTAVLLPSNPPSTGDGAAKGALSAGLRRQLGCANADFYKLTPAERDRCADRRAEARRDAPLLVVISPEKKAIFDGDCRKDDAWCLYRIGKGPYPGLFSLLKK